MAQPGLGAESEDQGEGAPVSSGAGGSRHGGPADAGQEIHRQIRGSGLLLLGRVFATVVNFGVQVLILRTVTPEEFGGFAYALAILALTQTVATFGLHRAVQRYLPVYLERGQPRLVLGQLLLVAGIMISIGIACILVVHVLAALGGGGILEPGLGLQLLLIMILLTPVQALDHQYFESAFAALGHPRAVIVRQLIIAPLARLSVVLLLVLSGAGVVFLAVGYVVIGFLGLSLYLPMLVRILREQDLLRPGIVRNLRFPAREAVLFSIPLLTTDVMYAVRHSLDAILVQAAHGLTEVAILRSVFPLARLNELVLGVFALLFMPLAARLLERQDLAGMRRAYWETAAWQAIAAYPIFIATFSFAEPTTVFVFGEQYRASAPVLAIMSAGFYLMTVVGQNDLALQVFGRVRYLLVGNLVIAAANLALVVLLIPPFGAIGAAVATASAMAIQTVVYQVGVWLRTGVPPYSRHLVGLHAALLAGALGLLALQVSIGPPLPVGLAIGGLVWLVIVRLNRHLLAVESAFPELLALPFVRRLLS